MLEQLFPSKLPDSCKEIKHTCHPLPPGNRNFQPPWVFQTESFILYFRASANNTGQAVESETMERSELWKLIKQNWRITRGEPLRLQRFVLVVSFIETVFKGAFATSIHCRCRFFVSGHFRGPWKLQEQRDDRRRYSQSMPVAKTPRNYVMVQNFLPLIFHIKSTLS